MGRLADIALELVRLASPRTFCLMRDSGFPTPMVWAVRLCGWPSCPIAIPAARKAGSRVKC